MKRKLLLTFLMTMLLACLFAICINAEGPKDLFSDVTILDNINKTTTFGYGETDFSRVVMKDPTKENTYITYPTYYVFDMRKHNSEGDMPVPNFSYLNTATERAGTDGEFKIEHIICIELPSEFTSVAASWTRTNAMVNLQYIKFSKNISIIHGSAFENNQSLSLIEFENNTDKDAILSVGRYAFDKCNSLVRIDFPVQLKVLSERSFGDCAKLEEVNFAEGTDFTLYNDDGTVKSNTLYAAFINDKALKSIRFPKGITSTGSVACSGCSNLEYVYIPSSCTAFEDGAFNNCNNLAVIEFEDGSQLQTIGAKSIAESSKITSLVFPNAFLTAAGEAPIRNLTSLTFINFGASFTGFTGYAGMYATNNKNLVVVLPSTFNVSNKDQLPTNATILYTGTMEQAKEFGYAKTQSYAEYLSEGAPTNDARIVYGYNVCTAFYEGEHDYTYEGSFQNQCASKCGRCGEITLSEAPIHTLDTVITYKNGYIEAGDIYDKCTSAGCGYENNSQAAPLIYFAGISTSYKGNGICVKYAVNKDAIEEYRELGNTFKYGIVACIPQENNVEVINPDLTNATDYNTIAVEIDESYGAFDFIMKGFKEEHYEMSLVMCAYVTDGKEVDYINTSLTSTEGVFVTQDTLAATITLKSVAEYVAITK